MAALCITPGGNGYVDQMMRLCRPERLRRGPALAAIAALAVLVAVGPAAPESRAPESTPGKNGRVLFVDDSGLATVNGAGRDLRELADTDPFPQAPNYSPDGRKIAFVGGLGDNDGFDLFVLDADGRRQRRLTFDGHADYARWSHDGSRLLIWVQRSFRPARFDVDVINADGTGRRRLFRRGEERRTPLWSPDGGRVAYKRHLGIYVSRIDGSGERYVTSGSLYDWLPDGTALVVERGGKVESVGLDGKRRKTLLSLTPSEGGFALAPDERRVAYVAGDPPGSGDDRLFLANVGGGGSVRVESDEFGHADPDWQPLCTLYGTERSDRLSGTPQADKICGLGGNDVILGRGGKDIILGGDGDDCIEGGAGNDWLFAGAGNDIVIGRFGGKDIVDGGPGRDRGAADLPDTKREVEGVASRC